MDVLHFKEATCSEFLASICLPATAMERFTSASPVISSAYLAASRAFEGFSHRYGVTRLVWFEQHETMEAAIEREKRIKKWNRAWKLRLIDTTNPSWRDLWPDIAGGTPTATPTSMDSRLRGNDEQRR